MFSDIDSETTRRLLESKVILDYAKVQESSRQNASLYKGLFFVPLYGALEYTATSVVQRCISKLNEKRCDISSLKPTLYSLIFDKECNSLIDSRDKKWTKRYDLFSKMNTTHPCHIEEHLFPTSTGNIKYQQMESIWKTFGISADVINTDRVRGRLDTLAENRNKIAHGRELPSSVGSAYTTSELEDFYNLISSYCSYILSVFEAYLDTEEFKK
jgi:hypothetical protein